MGTMQGVAIGQMAWRRDTLGDPRLNAAACVGSFSCKALRIASKAKGMSNIKIDIHLRRWLGRAEDLSSRLTASSSTR